MVEDEAVRRRRKLPTSTRTMLAEEYSERLRFLTYSRYFGRFMFVAILSVIGIHGGDEPRFRVAMGIAAFTLGFFWFLEEFRQSNHLIRLSHAIASSEEKTSPQYWQDNYIRYEYGLMYSFEERVLRQIGSIEPIIWSMGAGAVLLLKFTGL
jgi:hypothetical protein